MGRRIKKPAVRPERRKEWLRRFEEEGKSPPQIAQADGYDVRTVRKQIELARQEREAREARSLVLRQALERHYADLVAFAEKLEHALTGPSVSVIPPQERRERMWSALREHLPRSPIWRGVDRWEQLRSEIFRLQGESKRRLEAEVAASKSFAFAQGSPRVGLYANGLSGAATYRLRAMAERSDTGLPLDKIELTPMPEGHVQIAYANWTCARVPADQADEAAKFISGLISGVGLWPEYRSMERALSELRKVEEMLSEELATISLRRVVPGRCKYCPI